MKVIIAGSRGITTMGELHQAMKDAFKGELVVATEIVSGGARGVDAIGEAWGRQRGLKVKRFPADWKTHGRRAGPIRNRQMAEYADVLVAVWDGRSRGTENMIATAMALGLRVHVHRVEAKP